VDSDAKSDWSLDSSTRQDLGEFPLRLRIERKTGMTRLELATCAATETLGLAFGLRNETRSAALLPRCAEFGVCDYLL
jgi:hypothetical protein